jgi:hypothetical protein
MTPEVDTQLADRILERFHDAGQRLAAIQRADLVTPDDRGALRLGRALLYLMSEGFLNIVVRDVRAPAEVG